MIEINRILVLYGSQTFTAQEIAERIWRKTKALGFKGPVLAMDDYSIPQLIHEKFAIFVSATTGQGDEPDNMKKFWKFLLRKNLPSNSLRNLKFGVIGLGDSSYEKFNFVGKKLNKRLIQLGATPLLDVGLCDYQHDLGHDAVLEPWLDNFFIELKEYLPDIKTSNLNDNFIPKWKVSLIKNKESTFNSIDYEDIYFAKGQRNDYLEPKFLTVERNVRTTHETHFQDVRLITFRSNSDEKLEFKPGDIFNIRPRNSKEDIDDLFGIFQSHCIDIKPHYKLLVEEYHDDMSVPDFLQEPLTLYEIAEQYWDLRAYPTQYVFSLLALVSQDQLERDKCKELSSAAGQEEWLNYCRRPRRTILEVLHDFHKSTSKLTIDILFELFSTIKPRSFSIASSALLNGGYFDILVAVVKYNTKLKKPRLGLTSNWLKDLKIGDNVYGWIKNGTFKFPDENVPQILIGPGTGLAPFRSLLQERVAQNIARKEIYHLFFGCRYKDKDFHCKEELEKMVEEGKISLYCAFSRDQDNKIYVQHKISEHGDNLWKLIKYGGCIFISGNSKNMPDNVRDAFKDVFSEIGHLSEEESKEMLQMLEKTGRLQVETW
ncbi:PREDICTED: NADPH-dependent diflavin oxidoreductase 1 [Papilio polytes]|uniref:NADPH-dependent diflavin oxidoreductase 1 n=1 Tax=Papilio polytes TaxID=76194 RepID=UPI000676594E|nr:PREDICTED: NADPH-dependent diflavin oxidoreductase 1 [Papilio polytes]